jgi:hypothetical protein
LLVACAHNAAGSPAAEGALFLFCDVNGDGGAAAKAFGRQQLLAEKCGESLVAGGLVAHWSEYAEQVYECCVFDHDTLYCEFGYETNPTDAANIKQPDYPSRAAELLCAGIAAAEGFGYAPVVHPTAPEPEWKANLSKLQAPISGVLASPVAVLDTIRNEQVSELVAGTTLTVAYVTRVRNVEMYMTQWSVDHATGYAIAKTAVTFKTAGDASGSVSPPTPTAPSPPATGSTPPAAGTPAPSSPVPTPTRTPPPGGPVPLATPPLTNDWSRLGQYLINLTDHELVLFVEAIAAEFRRRVPL